MSTMIEAHSLCRSFGDHQAVNGISFSVKRGEVLGFLGPNGAGKSTTMKMLTCFLTPTSGSATVAGFDVQENVPEVQKRIGYLPENAPLYGEMIVRDFLMFVGQVRQMPSSLLEERLNIVVKQTSLENVLDQRIETLSKGYKRRVGLAQAILHDPEVLILDEPTDGLDPNQKHEVRRLIHAMSKDKCIIVSTHILEEVDAICTRALIISKGKVVADGTPVELKKKASGTGSIILDFANSEAASTAANRLRELPSLRSVELNESRLRVVPSMSKIEAINGSLQMLISNQIDVLDVYSEEAQLDEVFRAVTADQNS